MSSVIRSVSFVLSNVVQLLSKSLQVGAAKEVDIFSDGPASQMKNRFIYASLPNLRSHFKLRALTWAFFPTSHGKGPVDAIGGTVKRLVWQALLSRRVCAVTNAQEFLLALKDCSTNIHSFLSTADGLSHATSLRYLRTQTNFTLGFLPRQLTIDDNSRRFNHFSVETI
jgi:hypothetical protein